MSASNAAWCIFCGDPHPANKPCPCRSERRTGPLAFLLGVLAVLVFLGLALVLFLIAGLTTGGIQ